ncbi:hypothetical protein PV646_14640 [Streptomyces sp. ID05-26A]|nr:hypothetical protein [Streptomyces sp. ID05-26A]
MLMTTAASIFEGTQFNAMSLAVTTVGLLVSIAAAYFALRGPRASETALFFRERSVASILSSASHEMTGIAVTRNGETLIQPHIAVVEIENNGRKAVKSDHFDQDRPIVIDLDAPVVEVIRSSYLQGEESVGFKSSIDGTEVRLGPDLLPEKAVLTVQALTAGRPQLKSIDCRLANIKKAIRTQNPIQVAAGGLLRRGALVVVAILIGAAAGGAIAAAQKPAVSVKLAHMAVSSVSQDDQKQVIDDVEIYVQGYNFKEKEGLSLTITDDQNRVQREEDAFVADASGGFGWTIVMATRGNRMASASSRGGTVFLNIVRADGGKLVTAFELKGS